MNHGCFQNCEFKGSHLYKRLALLLLLIVAIANLLKVCSIKYIMCAIPAIDVIGHSGPIEHIISECFIGIDY